MDDLILKARLFEKATGFGERGGGHNPASLPPQGEDMSVERQENLRKPMYSDIDSMSGLKETFAAEDAPAAPAPAAPAAPAPAAPAAPAPAAAAEPVQGPQLPTPQRIKTGQGGFFGGVRNIADAAVDSVRAVGRGKVPTASERAISQQRGNKVSAAEQALSVQNQANVKQTETEEAQTTRENVRRNRVLGSAGALGGGEEEAAYAGYEGEPPAEVGEPAPADPEMGGDTLDLIEEEEPPAAPAVERPQAPQENRGLGGDVKLPGWRRGFDPKTVGATFGGSAVLGGIGAAAEYGTNWLANRFSSPTEAKMAKMLYDHQQFQADVGNIREKNTTEAIRYAYR